MDPKNLETGEVLSVTNTSTISKGLYKEADVAIKEITAIQDFINAHEGARPFLSLRSSLVLNSFLQLEQKSSSIFGERCGS